MYNINFDKKTVIVTGGNGGIGRAIAVAFLHARARVIILGRNQQRGVDTIDQLAPHGDAQFFAVDLSQSDQIEQFLAQIQPTHPTIDVLINCAGAGESRGGTVKLLEANQTPNEINQRWTDLSGSNLQSAYLTSALVAPHMPNGSSIINISSTASIHGNYGLYGTMKAGVEGLTRGLAVELASRNIRVNAISPGWIQTANTLPNKETDTETDQDTNEQSTWATTTSLLGRMGHPDEIANATLFLASPQASFITGTVLTVDGGLSIIDPTAEAWRTSVLD